MYHIVNLSVYTMLTDNAGTLLNTSVLALLDFFSWLYILQISSSTVYVVSVVLLLKLGWCNVMFYMVKISLCANLMKVQHVRFLFKGSFFSTKNI